MNDTTLPPAPMNHTTDSSADEQSSSDRVNPSNSEVTFDQAAVRHVANLVRIQVSDAEAETLSTDLKAMVDWVSQLQTVDVSEEDSLADPLGLPPYHRDGDNTVLGDREAILSNAPDRRDVYFAVPTVIE